MNKPQAPAELDSIPSVAALEDRLSQPTDGVVETMRRLSGDVIILGIAGKMGPTLAQMIKRASSAAVVNRRVIGVSRFSSGGQKAELEKIGIETIACDL